MIEMLTYLSWLTNGMVPALRRRLTATALCVVLGAVASEGCRRGESHPQQSQPNQSIARGDRVVVEQTAAQFFEGQVVGVQGDRLRVQTAEGEESVSVAVGDVYRLPPQGAVPGAGEHAICRRDVGRWVGCIVVSVNGQRVLARSVEGRQHQLGTEQVLVPTAVTTLNLRRYFKRAERRTTFVQAVKRAGLPRAPQGWRPSPRERVLGYRDSAWYSASIHEMQDERLRVRWQADGRISELSSRHVVPEPPHEPPPKRGQYALTRPAAPAQPWKPVQIVAVREDAIVVVNVEGQRRSVQARDLLALGE